MTFLDLVYETLSKHQAPLSTQDIWEKSEEYGIRRRFSTSGKTPVKTLSAQLYVDIRDNPNSRFYQYSRRPSTFYLKDKPEPVIELPAVRPDKKVPFKERDLHPLLISFVNADPHFKCVAKTILHEKSKRRRKGENEWLHPDIVGLYFPYVSFNGDTIDLMNVLDDCQYRLYSFEMKISVDFSTLREYFFQAVSNSSWANEGYLVALDYADDPDLQEEMLRLNNAFGIGFIKLNPENVEQSEILYPAKSKEAVDWDTIDRLADTNPDFDGFIKSVVTDIKGGGKPHLSEYDRVLSEEELGKHVAEHKIRR